MDLTAGARMHGGGVKAPQKPVGRIGRTRVAPGEDRRKRAAALVQSKQAVTEAGCADRVYAFGATRLLDRVTRPLDDAVRILLAAVVTAGRFAVFRGSLVEAMCTNRGSADVEGKYAPPGHRPDDNAPLPPSGGVAGGGDCAGQFALQVAEHEGLLQVGERAELSRPRAGRRDARADDRELREPFAQHLGSEKSAEALRLDDDHVEASNRRRDLGQHLVAEASRDEADEVADLRLGLEDEDASHGRHHSKSRLTIGLGSV